jgi:hypothetical protein
MLPSTVSEGWRSRVLRHIGPIPHLRRPPYPGGRLVRAPALVWMCWKVERPRAIRQPARTRGAERFAKGRALRVAKVKNRISR